MSKIVFSFVALFVVGCSSAADQGASDGSHEDVACKQPLGSACTPDASACFSYDVTGGTWAKCCDGTLTEITFGPDASTCSQ